MDEYKSNSHKSKDNEANKEDKQISKVIEGTATKRKKTLTQKFAGVFVPEDVTNVKNYVFFDIVIPLIKKGISETIDAILYPGGGSGSRRSSGGTMGSKISYSGYYDDDRRRKQQHPMSRQEYSYDNVVVETRGEAEAVISSLEEIIETYGATSVADLYELVGVSGTYTDGNYGWTDLRTAKPERTRDGWVLRLPRAISLK